MIKESSKSRLSSSRILITGGAGFIGSHLCERLLREGCQVIVLDDLSTGKRENIQHLIGQEGFSFHQGSIFDAPLLEGLLESCDLVFHLAAAVGVKLILEDTLGTLRTNILGTESILSAACKRGVPVYLASTSEVYGKSENLPFSESDDLTIGATEKNRWAYAASKIVDEFAALAYFREKGLPVSIFRFFNTVGPRQSGQYGMVVPRFIQQALRGQDLTIYGDGQQSRCFCDVQDAIDAMLGLAETSAAFGQVFNIGSTHSVTIEGLARQILQLLKGEFQKSLSSIIHIPYKEAYSEGFEDIRHRRPSISKLQTLTGWEPRVPLEETLRRIILELTR